MWFFPGWFESNWWNDSNTVCKPEEMRDALEHSVGFRGNSDLTSNESRILVSNKVTGYSV